MKCKIPEISWHNRDPVLSVDIQPKTEKSNSYRLASGGTDSHVLIWSLSLTECGSEVNIDVSADLTRHQRAVNAVKWSPSGELLASGDDESVVFIWKQKGESEPLNILDSNNEQDKEIWITLKVLRGHMEDVYDLSWSPNSQFIVSGSVDNTAIIWDVHKGKSLSILNDHKGFVQGVAWDPKNQYIATLSTDRYLRIFDIQTKKVLHRVSKSNLPVPEENELHGKRMRLFHDDTLQTFFRRLCFTPDGKLLITPAGVTDYDGVTHPMNTTYIFSRYSLKQPAIVLPCPDQYTVAVKCCPVLYKLRPYNPESNPPVIPLPYRMIFAIATKSSVYLYDTQQKVPFGLISNIHYTRLTDITWSNDGRIIIVSSTDGFCSIITFEVGELGEEYYDTSAVLTNVDEISKENKLKSKQKENEPIKEQPAPFTSAPVPDSATVKPADITSDKTEEKLKVDKMQSVKDEVQVNSVDTDAAKSAVAVPVFVSATPKLHLSEAIAAEIIIDKDIISSDEKFESPEKQSRPATPIMIRRHPRTPSTNMTPSTASSIASTTGSTKEAELRIKALAQDSSPISSTMNLKSPQKATKPDTKKPKPIAVRRKPRTLISTPIFKTAIVEEAMDAWPLDINYQSSSLVKQTDSTVSTKEKPVVESPNTLKAKSSVEVTSDRTEDIRLVYEDTVEEPLVSEKRNSSSPPKHSENVREPAKDIQTTPTQKQTPKTPRRVQLRTISTPKSKKKLIEQKE